MFLEFSYISEKKNIFERNFKIVKKIETNLNRFSIINEFIGNEKGYITSLFIEQCFHFFIKI